MRFFVYLAVGLSILAGIINVTRQEWSEAAAQLLVAWLLMDNYWLQVRLANGCSREQ